MSASHPYATELPCCGKQRQGQTCRLERDILSLIAAGMIPLERIAWQSASADGSS
jgi:hypothetical protein